MAVKINKNHIRWVNQNVSMKSLLNQIGIHIGISGKMFCPFHNNVNTPAAKFFEDSNQIRCFAEHRNYHPYDILTKIMHQTPDQLLQLIPKDQWYNCNIAETDASFKVPVVKRKPEDFERFIDYAYYLDQLWYNIEKVECRPL